MKPDTKPETLFISFSGLWYAWERGEISLRDLGRKALFAFGCHHDHVMGPMPTMNMVQGNYDPAEGFSNFEMVGAEWFHHCESRQFRFGPHQFDSDMYQIVSRRFRCFQIALALAEREGRVFWRKTSDKQGRICYDSGWTRFHDFLAVNGIEIPEMLKLDTGYCYPAVVEMVGKYLRVVD